MDGHDDHADSVETSDDRFLDCSTPASGLQHVFAVVRHSHPRLPLNPISEWLVLDHEPGIRLDEGACLRAERNVRDATPEAVRNGMEEARVVAGHLHFLTIERLLPFVYAACIFQEVCRRPERRHDACACLHLLPPVPTHPSRHSDEGLIWTPTPPGTVARVCLAT